MTNKDIVKRYWDGKWNARRPEILDELQAPDVVYHGPGLEMTSLEEYKQAYGAFLSAFHNTEITVEDLIGEGDRVVSRVVIRGVHKGDLPDLPATGRPFTLSLTTIFRLVDGKIVEECETYNELDLMQQLGMELVHKEAEK
jgi:steroid delta-isomerase-like uncharacterized protein